RLPRRLVLPDHPAVAEHDQVQPDRPLLLRVGEDVALGLGQAAEDAVQQPDPAATSLAEAARAGRAACAGRPPVGAPLGAAPRHRSASAPRRAAVSARSASLTFTMPRARPASSTGTVSAHRVARAGARRGTGTNGARARSATDCRGVRGAPTATSRAPRRAAASAAASASGLWPLAETAITTS